MRYLLPMNMEKQIAPQSTGINAALAAIAAFLDGQKAENVFVHVFRKPNPVCDAVVIATASSRRHAQGLADGLLRLCEDLPQEYLGMEGYEGAQWILVDCNDIIVHIFQPDTRQLYGLEDLCAEPEEKLSQIVNMPKISREKRS